MDQRDHNKIMSIYKRKIRNTTCSNLCVTNAIFRCKDTSLNTYMFKENSGILMEYYKVKMKDLIIHYLPSRKLVITQQ